MSSGQTRIARRDRDLREPDLRRPAHGCDVAGVVRGLREQGLSLGRVASTQGDLRRGQGVVDGFEAVRMLGERSAPVVEVLRDPIHQVG